MLDVGNQRTSLWSCENAIDVYRVQTAIRSETNSIQQFSRSFLLPTVCIPSRALTLETVVRVSLLSYNDIEGGFGLARLGIKSILVGLAYFQFVWFFG